MVMGRQSVRYRRVVVLLSVPLLAAFVPSLPAHAGPPASTTRVSQQQLDAVHQLVYGQPDRYAGIMVDHRAAVVHVYVERHQQELARTALTRAVATSATGASGSLRLDVVPVARSLRSLDAVMSKVTTQEPWASLTKNIRAVWYVDPPVNKVRIGLTVVTDQARAAAAAAFGDSVVLVRQDRHKTMAKVTRLTGAAPVIRVAPPAKTRATGTAVHPLDTPTRLLDASAYYGGDRIFRTYVQNGQHWVVQCTGNFVAHTSAADVMLTAGHCGPSGVTWSQGYFDQGTGTLYSTGLMGFADSVEWGNNRMDAETIGEGSYWVAAEYVSPTGAVGVAGSGSLNVGDSICADGSFTNESCNGYIYGVDACLDLLDDEGNIVHVCNQALAEARGDRLVQAGDSGGPVYNYNDQLRLTAQGIISGGTDDGMELNLTQMHNALSTFGATVAVGEPF